MKFMDYSYRVKTPLQTTFDYLIDLEQVQKDISLFKNAEVSSNSLPSDQLGKCYSVALRSGKAVFQTNIELINIAPPNTAVFEYSYHITDDEGQNVPIEDWPLMPWTNMTMIIGMEQEKHHTRVTSVLVANGISSGFGKFGAVLLSFVSRYQQGVANRKVVRHLNGMHAREYPIGVFAKKRDSL